jgi:A/G-specific adenine glycosylase
MWTKDDLLQIRQRLASWYQEQARPLPWRTETSLYRTVVSEFMCQQTQIDTVLPYFARWMKQFPNFAALAKAPESAVLKAWEGLGYYNRARNLQRLAKAMSERPQPPHTPEEWRELPGIGPYTAAAISSIVDDFPAAVVDGNVIRVIARLTAEERIFQSNADAVKWFQPLADALLDPVNPGNHNQAMMELGATVCLKARPLCLLCPVRLHCAGAKLGAPESFPRLQRHKTEKITIERLFCVGNKGILLHRAPAGSKRLADLAELPRREDFPFLAPAELKEIARKSRGISHQRITEPIYTIDPSALPAQLPEGHFWQPLERLESITVSGPHRRWLRELLSRKSG